MIVADTGPIIAFARLGRLDLLRDVVGHLTIPTAVYEELVGHGSHRPGAADVAASDWIRQRAVTHRTVLAELPTALHAGEREAIALAHELNAQLLIDEERGRTSALTRGLSVIGSLRVLADAKQQGRITAARPIAEQLRGAGYWIDEDVIRVFLQEIGESQ